MNLIGSMSLRQDVYERLGEIQHAIVPQLIHRADGHCVWDEPIPLGEVAIRLRAIANHIDEHVNESKGTTC